MNENEVDPVAEEEPLNNQQQGKPKLTGVDAMRAAVEKVLFEKAEELAKALVLSCLKGHMMAGRLLYMIGVDKVKADPEQVQKTRCIADIWKDEDEWTPEASEQNAETNSGSREPE